MNAFQEKLRSALQGNLDLQYLEELKPEDVWDAGPEGDIPLPQTSKKSIGKVLNPLPIPSICPHCAGNVKLQSNSVIYHGKEYGKWPYTYRCQRSSCHAYVGVHPHTFIPMGTLATAPMRDARKKAKAAFEPLYNGGPFSRTDAYKWLAGQLGIRNYEECHIGWFDVATCNRVIIACQNYQGD